MNSFISWIGGKRSLRYVILQHFPDPNSYERYIEVFGGAAWLLFAKDRHAKMEVYNDINKNLVNLFRCVKYHPEALEKELEWNFNSREQFLDAREQGQTRGFTDIQRAARFFLLIKESYGTDLKSFGRKDRSLVKATDHLQRVAERLETVVIESMDFEQLIASYDRNTALFYLDPPYYSAEHYYPDRFNPEDHERLRQCLDGVKGRFLVSYNDCVEIRELYEGYCITELERQNNLGTGRYKEILIKNY